MNKTTITGPWRFVVYVLFAGLFLLINYSTQRTDFIQLISLYACAFLLYVVICKNWITPSLADEGKWLGILIRFSILFSMPNLTDDFYRFIWDGHLTINHINPYAYTPDMVKAQHYLGADNIVLNDSLYNALNSKPYFTIYPPLSQFLFSVSAHLSGGNLLWNQIILKIFIFLFEIGSILLIPKILKQLNLNSNLQLLYTLNPLVILELTGNLHFEGIMIFFLLLAIYFLNKQKLTLSAIAFGFAIGAKLWPIMLMPLLFKRLGFKQTIIYSVISGVVSIIILFPMLLQYANIFSSLNLYFQQFEFNASVYYLLRWIINKDENFETFTLMRQLLPFVTIIAISVLSYFYQKDKFITALQLAFSIYCLFATTMHPWYITPLIMLSVFSGYRYAILWSLLIYFTYITYIDITYPENYFVVVMEYLVVIGYCGYEIINRNKLVKKNNLHIR